MSEFLSDSVRAKTIELMAEPSVNAMRERPGFTDVARTIALGWRAPEAGPERVFAMAMRDLGRFMSCLLAVYLHHSGGLTQVRLATLLDAMELAGAGRARALLLYMQFIGYVKPGPAARDTRLKPYVPTPEMVSGFGGRIRRELAISAAISGPQAALSARFDQPGVAERYFGAMGDIWIGYMQARKARLPGPSLELISERYAGMMMLAELLAGAEPDDVFPPRGPMRFTFAGVARACEVSRTQVRVAYRKAEAAGFLELAGEGVALPTPRLREHLELMIAGQIIGAEWVAARVLGALEEGEAPADMRLTGLGAS